MYANKLLSFLTALLLGVSVLGCRLFQAPESGAEIETEKMDYCMVVARSGSGHFNVICNGKDEFSTKNPMRVPSLTSFLQEKKFFYIERNVVDKSASAIKFVDRVLHELSVDSGIQQSGGSRLPLSGAMALQECEEIIAFKQDDGFVVALNATSYTITASLNAGRIYYEYTLH